MFIVNYKFAKPTIIGFCCCGFIVDCDHISLYFDEIKIMTCSKQTMPCPKSQTKTDQCPDYAQCQH